MFMEHEALPLERFSVNCTAQSTCISVYDQKKDFIYAFLIESLRVKIDCTIWTFFETEIFVICHNIEQNAKKPKKPEEPQLRSQVESGNYGDY